MNQWKLFYQGSLLLMTITLCGICIAQQQMSQLTQRQEAPFISVTIPEPGRYEIVWLGDSYDWRQAYEIGAVFSDGDSLYLGDRTKSFRLPLRYAFSWQPIYAEMTELLAGAYRKML